MWGQWTALITLISSVANNGPSPELPICAQYCLKAVWRQIGRLRCRNSSVPFYDLQYIFRYYDWWDEGHCCTTFLVQQLKPKLGIYIFICIFSIFKSNFGLPVILYQYHGIQPWEVVHCACVLVTLKSSNNIIFPNLINS